MPFRVIYLYGCLTLFDAGWGRAFCQFPPNFMYLSHCGPELWPFCEMMVKAKRFSKKQCSVTNSKIKFVSLIIFGFLSCKSTSCIKYIIYYNFIKC